MKNWKTTSAGLVAALPFAIDAIIDAYTAGYFTDKTGWQLFGSIAVIVITALVKDHDKDKNEAILIDKALADEDEKGAVQPPKGL